MILELCKLLFVKYHENLDIFKNRLLWDYKVKDFRTPVLSRLIGKYARLMSANVDIHYKEKFHRNKNLYLLILSASLLSAYVGLRMVSRVSCSDYNKGRKIEKDENNIKEKFKVKVLL